MRRRALASSLLVLLLASCGGDDDDADTGLSTAEAEDAVELALLDEDDLGEGWDQTATVEPDEEAERADPVDACTGAATRRVLDAAELAVSERRELERDGEGQFQSTRTWVRTVAYDDAVVVDELLALLAEDAFADCLVQQFEGLLGDTDSELTLQADDPVVDDEYLALDGVRSSHLSIVFHTSAPGFDFDAELDLVVVARGQLASVLQTIEVQGRVDGEDVARAAALLADRQRLAQSDT